MRILLVVQELARGGAERVAVALARGAQESGHAVALAAHAGPLADEIDADVFPMPLLGRRARRLFAGAGALKQALRVFRPDVVHCHNPGMAAAAALVTRRGRRPPALVSVHGVPDDDYRRAGRVLRLAGLATVACGPGVAAALEDEGVRVRATIVNGVSEPPAAADRAALERDWPPVVSRRLLLSVGRLVPQKNHALAIEAVARVPDAVLVIVGDGPLRPDLAREAAALGISGRVVLAGARPDARPLIGAADAVVLPSRWEGLPLVALEALAAGAPIVATAVRGMRELLVGGQTALLVRDGDAEALAAALRRVLEDRDLAARLADRGRALAAVYSEKAMVAAYLRLYEDMSR